jgi:hypothetical protein
MGVLNYNAYSQKEYDELREQFFRPPAVSRQDYGRGDPFNFSQMGIGLGASSSSDLLEPGRLPSGRGFERGNPFSRQ